MTRIGLLGAALTRQTDRGPDSVRCFDLLQNSSRQPQWWSRRKLGGSSAAKFVLSCAKMTRTKETIGTLSVQPAAITGSQLLRLYYHRLYHRLYHNSLLPSNHNSRHDPPVSTSSLFSSKTICTTTCMQPTRAPGPPVHFPNQSSVPKAVGPVVLNCHGQEEQ